MIRKSPLRAKIARANSCHDYEVTKCQALLASRPLIFSFVLRDSYNVKYAKENSTVPDYLWLKSSHSFLAVNKAVLC